MNIYEDELMGRKLDQITDQIGYLLLDLIRTSLIKLNNENLIHGEFQEVRQQASHDDPF